MPVNDPACGMMIEKENAVATAGYTGLAAIQVTLEEDLPGPAAAKGEFLLRELACLQAKYPRC